MIEIEYDITGQICPSSLLMALREVNTNAGRLFDGLIAITIKTDNRDAINTIPESVENMGLHATVNKQEGSYLIRISCGS